MVHLDKHETWFTLLTNSHMLHLPDKYPTRFPFWTSIHMVHLPDKYPKMAIDPILSACTADSVAVTCVCFYLLNTECNNIHQYNDKAWCFSVNAKLNATEKGWKSLNHWNVTEKVIAFHCKKQPDCAVLYKLRFQADTDEFVKMFLLISETKMTASILKQDPNT